MQTNKKKTPRSVARQLRFVAAASVIIGALVVVGSCQVPEASGSLEGGSLTVSIGKASSLTLVPSIDMTLASYLITGSGPNGSTFSQSTSGTSATISGLVFGQWTVSVSGKNAAGTIVAQGSGSVNVDTGKQSSLSVTVAPLPGNGTMSVSVSWTAASVQSPSISAQLLSSSGSTIPLTFTLGAGSASCQNASIPAGYYTLTLQLLDNGVLLMGAVEVARIVSAQTTSGTFDFTQSNYATGSVLVGITPVISDPLTVTLSGQSSTLALGSSMTVTASVAGSVGNVTYVWYVNGQSKATGSSASPSFSVGSALTAGVYRLDVTAFTADGLRAGAASCSFTVQ